jgi:TRAP-type C4-dicarboxylate transport system permease small subunit
VSWLDNVRVAQMASLYHRKAIGSTPAMRILNFILKKVDGYLERVIIFTSLFALVCIVILGVIQRFVFGYQNAWTGSLPVYFFLWVTWIGAAYNVKTRQQLRFTEIRQSMPPIGKLCLLALDNLLWVGVAIIVVFHSVTQVMIAKENFAVVQGTMELQQWWFYLATPLGWGLIIVRALQNFHADVLDFMHKRLLDQSETVFTAD